MLINLINASQHNQSVDSSENFLELTEENLSRIPIVKTTFSSLNSILPESDFDSTDVFNEEKENDSVTTSSVVSESFLENLGLRSSRSSTPSLHSPSQNLRKISSSGHFPFIFPNPKVAYDDMSCDSDSSYELSYIGLSESEDSCNEEAPVEVENVQEPATSTLVLKDKSRFKIFPNEILSSIMEFCDGSTLLISRLVNKRFKETCEDYLSFVSNLTLKPEDAARLNFKDKLSLLTTMMPFYRNQPQIRHILTDLLQTSWHMLSPIKLTEIDGFKDLQIFSDDFIVNVLIPRLITVPQESAQDPPLLFLLGEALLKSNRVNLFEATLLPILNQISTDLLVGIPTPIESFVSPGFIQLQDGQVVLGATLHACINFNLTLTVKHIIKIFPSVIKLKNHCGRTALLKIAENLGKWPTNLPGPLAGSNINEWIEETFNDFYLGNSLQKEFPGNSRLLIEMFLEIVNQISEITETPEETVRFLGLSEVYDIYTLTQGIFRKHRTSLLKELVTARQYDLLLSVGFYFGNLIRNNLEHNNLLHSAAEINNPVLIAILLRFFPSLDVNQLTISGCTAVGVATGRNLLDSLRVLLNDPRVDPNLNGNTGPLLHSIELGHTHATALLLSHPSIQIHHQVTRKKKTRTPLERAVTKKNWRVVELLLRSPYQHYDTDFAALPHLQEADKQLTKLGDDYWDLLQLVRRLILPTINE